jgi:hypothetical protein
MTANSGGHYASQDNCRHREDLLPNCTRIVIAGECSQAGSDVLRGRSFGLAALADLRAGSQRRLFLADQRRTTLMFPQSISSRHQFPNGVRK